MALFLVAFVMLVACSTAMTTGQHQAHGRTFHFSPEVAINLEIRGASQNPMLLLHGFGASLETWRDIQPSLERHFQLYLVDLKGFGLSSKPDDEKYSIGDQADIIVALIERHNLDNLMLVGHSYGGAVALFVYLKLKDTGRANKIASLVLIDAPTYLQPLPFFLSVLRTPVLRWAVLNIVPATWRARFTLTRLFHDPSKVTPERVDRYARFFDLPGSHKAYIQSAKLIIPDNPNRMIRRIPEIAAPTLIIWGQNDPILPVEHASRFQREVVGSRLQIIPQSGHIPHEEKPLETFEAILKFLQ